MAQNLYKTGSWFQQLHDEFGYLQTTHGKSMKLKFNGLHISKKYIPSAKTLYTEDLSNITLNYCKNSPNFLCHYGNHKSFFTTQFVTKVQTFRFSTDRVKIHQIIHVIIAASILPLPPLKME